MNFLGKFGLALGRVYRFRPETPSAPGVGRNRAQVSQSQFRVVGCRAFCRDFEEGSNGKVEEMSLFLPVMRHDIRREIRKPDKRSEAELVHFEAHTQQKFGRPSGRSGFHMFAPHALDRTACAFLKPKQRGPDQWAPVISRATSVRDR